MLSFNLSSVGEEIIPRLLEKAAESGRLNSMLLKNNQETRLIDFLHRAGIKPPFSFNAEVPLEAVEISSIGQVKFDGQHRIDVVIHSDRGNAVGVELKIGETRLSADQFEKRFLKPVCLSSHKDARIRGSMAAVLDRKGILAQQGLELKAKLPFENSKPLAQGWLLVVRCQVGASWDLQAPSIKYGRILVLEDLIKAAGGPDCFNEVVADVLCHKNFFADWLREEDEPRV